MLVLIEGPDGAGKTTTAQALAAATGAEYLHAGPPTTDPIAAYLEPLEDYRPGQGRHVVCDRWHLGEDVYGPIYRGRSELDAGSVRRTLNNELRARGALLVLLTETPDVLRSRLEGRGHEDFIALDDLPRIVHGFERAFARSQLRKVYLLCGDHKYLRAKAAQVEEDAK